MDNGEIKKYTVKYLTEDGAYNLLSNLEAPDLTAALVETYKTLLWGADTSAWIPLYITRSECCLQFLDFATGLEQGCVLIQEDRSQPLSAKADSLSLPH